MLVTRTSTYSLHQQLLTNVSRAQGDLAMLQDQISSGKIGDTFAEMNGRVERYTSLKNKMDRSQRYYEQNSLVVSRLNVMMESVDGLIETGTELRNLVLLRRNSSVGEDVNLELQADALLARVAGLLNTNIEGRYLFAGSKTDTVPVDDPIPMGATGVADDGYYNGDNVDLTVRAHDSLEVSYGVRANEEGFQKLIASINTAKDGDDEAQMDVYMQAAMDMVNEAIDDMVSIKGELNAKIVILQKANEKHEALRLYWKGVTDELTQTDLVEASTQVSINEGILQASFQAFARTSNLRLADFL